MRDLLLELDRLKNPVAQRIRAQDVLEEAKERLHCSSYVKKMISCESCRHLFRYRRAIALLAIGIAELVIEEREEGE